MQNHAVFVFTLYLGGAIILKFKIFLTLKGESQNYGIKPVSL